MDNLKISIGPAPYNWGKKRLMDFYLNEIPTIKPNEVYIGNTICHKREVLDQTDLKVIANSLRAQDIKTYYSTLSLCTTAEEFNHLKSRCNIFDGIEINMLGFLNIASKGGLLGREIVLGPYLNLYNWKSVAYLKKFHPKKMVASFELPLDSISDIAVKADIPTEVTVWGNISTALSWRCYTARAVNRSRENCGKICFEYPQGMLLKSVEQEDLFIVDGLQVQSAKTHCLVENLQQLADNDISSIRIYPQMENSANIVNIFRKVINNQLDSAKASQQLTAYAPHGLCNGWLLGKPGWEYVAA